MHESDSFLDKFKIIQFQIFIRRLFYLGNLPPITEFICSISLTVWVNLVVFYFCSSCRILCNFFFVIYQPNFPLNSAYYYNNTRNKVAEKRLIFSALTMPFRFLSPAYASTVRLYHIRRTKSNLLPFAVPA